MQTMDQCLQELVRRNLITLPEARSKASSKETFPG
jgi:twitching motility protein PilT